jgi:hypothetical protein
MNQLIAKVSSVPRVRQLMALSTDRICVSAPRNETTRYASIADDGRTYHAGIFRRHRRMSLPRKSPLDMMREHVHFARILGKLLDLTE